MLSQNFEKHYRDLFEKTSDLVHFATIEGNIAMVNTAWLNTLGYTADEVIGQSLFSFISDACKAKFREYREQVLRSVDPGEIRTVFVTKSGKHINVEGLVGASFEDGKPIYTRGVFRNITEKVIAEKRLQTFFHSAPDAVVVINQNEIILDWNPKAEDIFGYTNQEILGKKLSETIIPIQYREAHRRGMQHFLATGDGPVLNKTIEITALHKDGSEFYVNLSISNANLDGDWLFIAFISDISERKRTEEELIHKEALLLQSKLMEEKKDEFLSIASHELKTPLTTIKAYTQIAISQCKDNGMQLVKQYLTKVDQYATRLNNLINELLDVSKIQTGKLKISGSNLQFDQFLEEVINSIQHITSTHKIRIIQNDPAILHFDPLRLEQVLTNVIGNSAKYSPEKNEIIVSSKLNPDSLVVTITDYGIGISKENLENIFSRFYRVDEGSKRFSGLGIGLYISSEIIKQHGGKIWAESIPGEYTSFFIQLPLDV